MSHLRLLILHDVNFSGSFKIPFNELRYLSWNEYPFTRLPSYFQPDKLVELLLPHSNIERLWEDIKPLKNLRTIDLYRSENLVEISNFRVLPNLERLNLEGCIKLVHIDSSIEQLQKLAFLNLEDCKSLMSLTINIFCLSSLEVVRLSGCSKVFKKQLLEKARPEEHLKKLDNNETVIPCQSTSFVCRRLMTPFPFFYTRRQKDSVCLLFPSLPSFPCMRDLDLSFCNLRQIPDAIGSFHFLERLNLGGNNIGRLPSSIKELSRLINLNLEHCKQLKFLPELPSSTFLPSRRHECSAGLYIFNCPKLANIEGSSSMAYSWMMQMLQVQHECSLPLRGFDIVIPGGQIPRWFNHQSVGDSISIGSYPTMHDNNWIGIAFCVAFVAHPTNELGDTTLGDAYSDYDDPNNFSRSIPGYNIQCSFKTLNAESVFLIPKLSMKDVVTVESEHLWVFYFPQQVLFTDASSWPTDDRDGFKFVARTHYFPGSHMKVTNCGLRWVFKQDLEELKRTESNGESSSIQIHDDLGMGGSILSLEAGNSSD